MDIGSKIKEIRTKKKISQRKLAEKIGVSGQFISLVEIGNSAPSIDTLNKIADALEVSINELIGASAPQNSYEHDFDISKILNKEFIDEATNLFTPDQRTAFNAMYFLALKNIGIIEGLKEGDMHHSFVDDLYLSVSFIEIFRNFNDEIQQIYSGEKLNFSSTDVNSTIELLAKYTYQAYMLLRKSMLLLEEGENHYIENLDHPFFEEEIFSKYLNK